MKSMTGYSKVNFENDDFKIRIEMKSVNNKNLNINLKHSHILNFLSNKIQTIISKYIKRGSLLCRIDFEDKRENSESLEYDENLSKSYFNILTKLEEDFSEKLENKLDLIVKYPNIIKKKDDEIDEKEYEKLIIENLKECINEMNKTRQDEGTRMKEFFIEKIAGLEKIVTEIDGLRNDVVKIYRENLLDKINSFDEKIKISEEDILKELLIYADKSDITEEVSRLKSHIEQFKKDIDKDNIGKKLDFILQEMFREMNTTGVKANYYEISKRVVDGKSELEKMREQVQNIE